MKLFGKLLISVLIIGMLLPFTVLKGKDGKTLMSFSDFKLPDFSMPDVPSLPKTTEVLNSTSTGSNNVIYQWTDTEGNIQFSSEPPPEGVEYTKKGYDPNLNVIQAVESPVEDEAEQKTESNEATSSKPEIGSVYSPEKIEKLFKDAENIEKLLNDRIKNQEAIIGQ